MPKTVTVSYPLEVPDGYELASDTPEWVDAESTDELYLATNGEVWEGAMFSNEERAFRLRPIATEKTWELPGIDAEWLTHDWGNGYTAWKFGRPVMPINKEVWTGVNNMESMRLNERFLNIKFPHHAGPPAERIWKIVERGEG